METYCTATETPIRFASHSYPEGTYVRVLSALVHDGVALCRFPEGEETYVAAYRLTTPPPRAEEYVVRDPESWQAVADAGRKYA